jgi:signal transduction histidine kinase/DNA-binding response OmpR family regulator
MVITSASLLVACLGFVAHDLTALRLSLREQLAMHAGIIGGNSTAALRFRDADDAAETLRALRADPHLTAAAIYTKNGQVLARYFRDEPLPLPSPAEVIAELPEPAADSLECSRPVWLNGEKIGYVYLRCDLDELSNRTRTYAIILAIVLLGSLSLALVLALWLARAVSGPIVDLTQVAQDVCDHGNYAIRAERRAGGELGVLVDCFNNMLAQIEERGTQLEAHRDRLEEQVATRTRELSLLNQEITVALDRAEAANRAKSSFLANMSHEIRTPMTAILGYSDMLLEPMRTPSDRYDCLQVIRRNAKHLMELINDILDLSKIEAEKMTVEKIPVELPSLLSEIASMIRPRAIDKKLGFGIRFDGLVPRVIQSDPLRLKQVLMNLIGNALKFTHAGAVSLVVSCPPPEPDVTRRRLRLAITDTGIGMSEEQAASLFQPFAQADDSTSRKYGGTGLGLVISRRLARLMGGDIAVSSNLGSGSTFTMEIDAGEIGDAPMLERFDESLSPAPAAEQHTPSIRLRGRILLAEDGPDNQLLLSLQLREAGAEVVIADNGRIAVELARREPFDLIFMDMQMPELDGYAATSRLRELGCKVPIVALTAHAMSHDRAKCLAAGCSDYCAKPIEKERLLTVASLYLQRGAIDRTGNSEPVRSAAAKTATMARAVNDFVGRLPQRVTTLSSLLAEQNLAELRRALHQIKGAGSGFGFPDLTALAARAESAVKSSEALEDVASKVGELVQFMRRIEGYDLTREQGSAAKSSDH